MARPLVPAAPSGRRPLAALEVTLAAGAALTVWELTPARR